MRRARAVSAERDARLAELRTAVVVANHAIATAGLVRLSFGNASAADREEGVFGIKPSGVACGELRPEEVVILSLRDGEVVEGTHRPSSDTPTHLVLYRAFPAIGGVVHTHSAYATAWAQAARPIPCLGTTHADHFRGAVPVTRQLTSEEVEGAYEVETGEVVVECLRALGCDPLDMPAVLVASHGPFVWGRSAAEAAENATALELVAAIALDTLRLQEVTRPIDDSLLTRHFTRKHGPSAYYGQGR